jgi:hypothetical protein
LRLVIGRRVLGIGRLFTIIGAVIVRLGRARPYHKESDDGPRSHTTLDVEKEPEVP